MALNKLGISNNTNSVSIISSNEEEELTMEVSAEMGPLLTELLTSIYNKPIESMIRETISNAFDATVLVPVDEQRAVEVTTPTLLSPLFVVRDYGTGMSPDTVRKVYRYYGMSTKGKDFNQLGAYGLGAKAPLAYCNEFQVSTTKDGVTTEFTVARKTNNTAATITSVTQTDLPNGTVVTIPAKSKDIPEFDAALKRYYDAPLEIGLKVNGEIVGSPEEFFHVGDFLLDEESKTTGRILIKKNKIASAFLSFNFQVPDFVLGGWTYTNPRLRRNYNVNMYVELKPGVVDFPSSRDAIIDNDRFDALITRWGRDYETFPGGLSNLFRILRDTTTINEFADFVKGIIHYTTMSDDNTTVVFNDNSTLAISEFRHPDGGDNLAEHFTPGRYDSDLIGIILIPIDNVKSRTSIINTSDDPRLAYNKTNVSITNSRINKSWELGPVKDARPYGSLTEMIRARISFHTPQEYAMSKSTVVTVDTRDNLNKMLGLLSQTTTEMDINQLFIVRGEVVDKERDFLSNNFGLKFCSVTDLIKILSAERTRRRNLGTAEQKSQTKGDVGGYVVVGFNSWDSVLKQQKVRTQTTVTNISAEIEKNSIIIVSSRSQLLNVICGVANTDNMDPLGERIVVFMPSALRAGDYEELMNYPKAFSAEVGVSLKNGKEFIKNKTRHAEYPLPYLKGLSLSEQISLVWEISRNLYMTETAAEAIASKLPDCVLADVVRSCPSVRSYRIDWHDSRSLVKLFRSLWSDEVYAAVESLNKFLDSSWGETHYDVFGKGVIKQMKEAREVTGEGLELFDMLASCLGKKLYKDWQERLQSKNCGTMETTNGKEVTA